MAASFNLTIEDSSPLITYSPSGAWRDALPLDTNGLSYSGASFHSTATPGATISVNFNGTGISFYGGHRPDYGTYTITVDGDTIATGRASAGGIELNQLLGSTSGLKNGPHTAVLTNTGPALDIDRVELQTQVGADGSTTSATVYDDADPAITYAGAWETNASNAANYLNNTLHYTQAVGAAASLKFSGNGVAVYGTVSGDHANIQISIDGKTTMVDGGSSFVTSLHPKTLLYYANDLDSTEHTLIVTNPGQQDGTGPFIDLDSITVYSASSLDSLDGAAASTEGSKPVEIPGPPSKPASGLSTGTTIGIAVGVLALVLVVLSLFGFLFLRKRRRRQAMVDPKTPADAELPLQGPNMRFTPISPAQPVPTFSRMPTRMSSHSIAPSYYGLGNGSQASISSTTPILPKVPTLAMPRVPSRAQQTLMISNGGPNRPNRPPSLDLRGQGG